jgi:hypothetical protein
MRNYGKKKRLTFAALSDMLHIRDLPDVGRYSLSDRVNFAEPLLCRSPSARKLGPYEISRYRGWPAGFQSYRDQPQYGKMDA